MTFVESLSGLRVSSSASGRNAASASTDVWTGRQEKGKVSDEIAAQIKAALSDHFKAEQATPRPVPVQTFVRDVREPFEAFEQLALSDAVYAQAVESAADMSIDEEPDFAADEADDTREVET